MAGGVEPSLDWSIAAGQEEKDESVERLKKQLSNRTEIRRQPAETVILMIMHAEELLALNFYRQLALSVAAGHLIAFGAALSVFLSFEVSLVGPKNLLLGMGFGCGFLMVVLTGSTLFTEINVVASTFLAYNLRLRRWKGLLRLLRFWVTVYIGNIVGALLLGEMLYLTDTFTQSCPHAGSPAGCVSVQDYLHELVVKKVRYLDSPFLGWFQVVLSGIIGNTLVGLAAFFASAGRTLPGKAVGVFVPVVAFVSLGVQHSPANMGYLFLDLLTLNSRVTWFEAVVQNLIPASIGNLIGGMILSLVMFGYVYGPNRATSHTLRKMVAEVDREDEHDPNFLVERADAIARWLVDKSSDGCLLPVDVVIRHMYRSSSEESAAQEHPSTSGGKHAATSEDFTSKLDQEMSEWNSASAAIPVTDDE